MHMPLTRPPVILDIVSLLASISALKEQASAHTWRVKVVQILREPFQAARAAIRARFEASRNAAAALKEQTQLMDALFDMLLTAGHQKGQAGKSVSLAVVAVGGYGRRELFPFSDVDVLFLHKGKMTPAVQARIEFMLYVCWDLGVTVGHAVRSVQESVDQGQRDMTIRTALLDARLVCGDEAVFQEFTQRFQAEVVEGSERAFVEAKLEERDKRHQRSGDSRYVLEPNIKDGKGGLRDVHTLYWIIRYCYPFTHFSEVIERGILTREEYKAFTSAYAFLSLIRICLHYAAGRAEERLTFDMQQSVGALLGYTGQTGPKSLGRFMKRYFLAAKTVGSLTRTLCAVLEEEKKRTPRMGVGALLNRPQTIGAFLVDGERLNLAHEDIFTQDPVLLLDLFATAQEHGFDIHPHALRRVAQHLSLINHALRKDARANAVFLKILTSKHNPEITLKRMSEAGVLGRFIPDFGRVTGQMQYDRYHVFTVDEHTLFALGTLHAIERGEFAEHSPVATEIIHKLESKRVLYLALLCHDIAKGCGKDHSEMGEKIAQKLAAQLGFSAKEQELAGWLVRHHLLMSMTAFKRDINDPRTLQVFIQNVQSPERLRLLLVLTVADIRAVGPGVWNGWKGALLRDLYYQAEAMMGVGMAQYATRNLMQIRASLSEELSEFDPAQIAEYMALGPEAFATVFTPAEHARIARLVRALHHSDAPFMLDISHDHFRAISEVMLVTPDHYGLFSKVAGVMALAGANIVSAKIYTLKNGLAVESFGIQDADARAFDSLQKLAKLSVYMERALTGELDYDKELARQVRPYASRKDAIKIPPAVFIENTVSATHTVIEVNGHDRLGFLHALTRDIARLGLNIASAHISTYGNQVVDVFYVKDVFGMKITHESKLRQIRESLMAVLAQPARKVA